MKPTTNRWLALVAAAVFVLTPFAIANVQAQDEAAKQEGSAQTSPPTTPPETAAPGTEGQAPETAPAAPVVDELPKDFAGLKAKWEELRAKMIELRERFSTTSEATEKDTIRTEYTALTTQATNVIDRLRDAALTGLSADNLDAEMLNTLMGIMLNDANSEMDDRVLATADSLIAMGVPAEKFETAAKAERLSIPAREIFEEILIRQREHTADDLPRVKITTNRGVIEIELFENEAPNTVANFISLAKSGFYKGLKFHRVIEGFMAQGGKPNDENVGGPGYTIDCECQSPEARRHFTGSISMANAGRDTGGSQFFITFSRNASVRNLDAKHTVFGRVINGLDILNTLTMTHESTGFGETPIAGAQPDVIESMEVIRDRGHEYVPAKTDDKPVEKAEESKPPTANPPAAGEDAAKKDGEGEAAKGDASGDGAAGDGTGGDGAAKTGGDGQSGE